MSYNRKAIADALSKMNKAKKPKQPKDIIKDPEGQYKYPGVPTRIASDNITMQGVSYPVLGVDNLGNQQMMYPGAEYVFPGADYVDEFPIAKYGGLVTGLTNTPGNLLMNKKGKRMMAQSGSLSATNKMFLGNPMVTKRKKSVFVPGAPFQEGGNTSDPGMDAMMKARFAYAHMHGNPAAQRMTYPVDNPYIFTGTEPYTNPNMAGEFGTHYMFSQDNYAVPTIQQDEYGNLIYNPEANYTNPEAIQFDRPEDAEYFAEYYKQIAPGMQTGGSTDWKSRIASAMNFKKGGQLSKEEFEKRKAAYKKMTGRDFEPPKSFKPTQRSKEYYQQKYNQQPLIKGQSSETVDQSRGIPTEEIERLKIINAPVDPRVNQFAFEADNRTPEQRQRDQAAAKQLTDPDWKQQVVNAVQAPLFQAGNFWDYAAGGDDWKKAQQAYNLNQLSPYSQNKMSNFLSAGLSNTGNALMTGMEIADGYALARAIPGIQSQVGRYLSKPSISNTPKQLPGSGAASSVDDVGAGLEAISANKINKAGLFNISDKDVINVFNYVKEAFTKKVNIPDDILQAYNKAKELQKQGYISKKLPDTPKDFDKWLKSQYNQKPLYRVVDVNPQVINDNLVRREMQKQGLNPDNPYHVAEYMGTTTAPTDLINRGRRSGGHDELLRGSDKDILYFAEDPRWIGPRYGGGNPYYVKIFADPLPEGLHNQVLRLRDNSQLRKNYTRDFPGFNINNIPSGVLFEDGWLRVGNNMVTPIIGNKGEKLRKAVKVLSGDEFNKLSNPFFQQGGSIQPLDYFDTELTDQEIEQYKKGGCVVVKL